MAKFRKKPVIIEAEQWWPDKHIEGVEIVEVRNSLNKVIPQAQIKTLEGPLIVSPGDWIIIGVKGERYACKDDIFRLTYEPLDDAGNPKGWGDRDLLRE